MSSSVRCADTRKQLERLHLCGLVVEAWGAALIAAGIAVNTWAGWIAATPVAQAVLLGCAVGAVGWVVNDEDGRWWRA